MNTKHFAKKDRLPGTGQKDTFRKEDSSDSDDLINNMDMADDFNDS